MLTTAQIISIVVFVVVMALVVSEKIHRAVAALAGAVTLLVISSISAIGSGDLVIFQSFDAALDSIDFNTLAVLCGMMMFVGVVKLSGMFEFVAIKSAKL